VALATRRNGADEDSIPNLVADQAGSELGNDTNRLVAHDQARLDRILALQDVHVSTADRRQRDSDHGLARTGRWSRDFVDTNIARPVEDCGTHRRRALPAKLRSGTGCDCHGTILSGLSSYSNSVELPRDPVRPGLDLGPVAEIAYRQETL